MKVNKITKGLAALIAFIAFFVISGFYVNAEENSAPQFKSYSYKISDTEEINYWLFTPANAAENMPLIVYLHGGSGKGDDINQLVQPPADDSKAAGFCYWTKEGKFNDVPAYIVFPQLSSDYKAWADAKETVRALIEHIVNTQKIDKTRISLTGHSMGGTGTLSIAAEYPRLFSCIAPMSGSVPKITQDKVDAIASLPTWAFIGSEDKIVKPENSMEIINTVKEYGGEVNVTVIDGADHFSVPYAYLDDNVNVVNWLIGHKKENKAIGESDGSAVIRVQQPDNLGDTSNIVISAYDDEGRLFDCTSISKQLDYGLNKIVLPEIFNSYKNVKIMIWNSTNDVSPEGTVYIRQ